MNPLDRPVWNSLTTAHLDLSVGDQVARRYLPEVNLFAASQDHSPASLARLADLIKPGDDIFQVEAEPIASPPGMQPIKEARCVQMVGEDLAEFEALNNVHVLGPADAGDMLELATLTEPGPFAARTHEMGRFIGLRIKGRLAAMAGERMRFPGFTEVSGVCTHPDFRGQGLARRLSAQVAADIRARGETPFLHSWTTNDSAIRLYEGLGFRARAEINVAVLRKG